MIIFQLYKANIFLIWLMIYHLTEVSFSFSDVIAKQKYMSKFQQQQQQIEIPTKDSTEESTPELFDDLFVKFIYDMILN